MPTDVAIEAALPASPYSLSLRWICLVLAALIVGLLFYLGAKPVAVGLFPEPWDKLAHFIVFAGVAGLFWIGLAGRLPLAIIGLVAGIGVLDEWRQAAMPGRSADFTDFLTDLAAASFAVFVLQRWRKAKTAAQRG